jgi:acyl carrier protein
MLDPRLVEAISDVFGIPLDEVTAESSRETIADWDSVGHLKLILHLEESCHVRFAATDIPEMISVARIQEVLSRTPGIPGSLPG